MYAEVEVEKRFDILGGPCWSRSIWGVWMEVEVVLDFES
jgi:hypothetical protein